MSSPPSPSRVIAIRRHPAFEPLATWLAAFLPRPDGHPPTMIMLPGLAPALRDQVIEEASRAASALDPAAVAVARHRARDLTLALCEQLADAVRHDDRQTMTELAVRIADTAIDTYRHHLAYGPTVIEGQS